MRLVGEHIRVSREERLKEYDEREREAALGHPLLDPPQRRCFLKRTIPCSQKCFSGLCLLMSLCLPLAAADLKNAVVVTPAEPQLQEKTAVTVLVEEVQKRTQMKLAVQNSMPASGTPAIVVGTSSKLSSVAAAPLSAE